MAAVHILLLMHIDFVVLFVSDKRVLACLHLQMSLYFNAWFFPLWWISESVMLHTKVRQQDTDVLSK